MSIIEYLETLYERGANKTKVSLVITAISKHGVNLTPCKDRDWDNSFIEESLNNVDTLGFWYNTEDKSTHCQISSI